MIRHLTIFELDIKFQILFLGFQLKNIQAIMQQVFNIASSYIKHKRFRLNLSEVKDVAHQEEH